ncbi:MAG TPA: post-COAP-1 domain-containing protein, partial [Conexibacter sp.]
DANGQRDAGEPGLPGWTMQLTYEGVVVASTITGSDGSYAFQLDANALPIGAGTYQVVEVQQGGWNAAQAPGPVTVPLGAAGTTYGSNDFGNYRNATIAGHKFDDSDVDGLWDRTELGLANWTIQSSGGVTDTATGGDGAYAFSVRPGTYTVNELLQSGWRQTAPGGAGTRTYTVVSGQVVSDADFGNVCLGGVSVGPVDDSTGQPLSGLEVRIEEVSVPGILTNDPALPRTTTGTPTFGDLLPGTYRVTAFLPDGVFTTDPDAVVVGGRFAIVKQATVSECGTTRLPLHFFIASTPGKVTGGALKLLVPGGFATSGFEFMGGTDGARGTLEYQDHATGMNLHTKVIEAVSISGNVAWVWGRVDVAGTSQRFRLRLVDAGEPGRSDRYELTLATGYTAGFDGPIAGGNVQIHR